MPKRKDIIIAILTLAVIILAIASIKKGKNYRQTIQVNKVLSTEVNQLTDQINSLQNNLAEAQRKGSLEDKFNPTFVDRALYFRQHWNDYITLSVNKYKTSFLGGLKNISVQVVNNTDFSLDQVELEIRYFRTNNKLFKTEIVTINDLSSSDKKTATAPDSPRGGYIKASFRKIKSHEMNFCYDATKEVASSSVDPYKCR